MGYSAPDIQTFKEELNNSILAIKKLKTDSHVTIKIQSLLNITAYVLATRFLEGAIKHIVFNCCVMRGDSKQDFLKLSEDLKAFSNPEFRNIVDLFQQHLSYDICTGKNNGSYKDKDITFLNQVVNNRHKNVHATEDSRDWYDTNQKDLRDFEAELIGLENILRFLDSIKWDDFLKKFVP